MAASHERVPNKHLSGPELCKIIESDVHNILQKDGMFGSNVGFARVAYEVRVTVHMDNPMYPEHVSVTASKVASKQQVEAKPELGAIELGPLIEPISEEETIFSEEVSRQISSPNMARVEHELPLQIEKRNHTTGAIETVQQKFVGDMPDPAEVGNTSRSTNTTQAQRDKWGRPKRKR